MEEAKNLITNSNITIPVVFACDDKYAQHLSCAIASLLKNKGEEEVEIFILTDYLSNKNIDKINSLKTIAPCNINFIYINNETLFKGEAPQTVKHISISTYYRFLLQQLFPNTDKLIYLDSDLNILTSLTDLYNTDISEYYIAAVTDNSEKECCKRLNLDMYCNAGVLLINLKKFREDNIQEKLFKYSQENYDEIVYGDQDVLNVVCQEKILQLDKRWNAQICNSLKDNEDWLTTAKQAHIIHYISGLKPWKRKYGLPYKSIYLEYLKLTPWKNKVYLYKFYSLLYKLYAIRKSIISIKWEKDKKVIKLFNKTLYSQYEEKYGQQYT